MAAKACLDGNYTDSIETFRECIRDAAVDELRYMSSTEASVFTFIYACISLLGALGNGLVIIVVARRSEMRTTRNVFIVNLAISNFLLALILVPFLWLPTYRIEFPYGEFMCKVAQAFPSTNIFCSTLTVSVIAVDRYFVVVRASFGPGRVKTSQAIWIALSIWIVSFALSILYLLHFHTKEIMLPAAILTPNLGLPKADLLLFQRCELKPSSCMALETTSPDRADECYKFYEAALSALSAVFIYLVPMPVLVVFSCLLSRFLSKNQRQNSSLRHRVCLPMAMEAAGGGGGGGGDGRATTAGAAGGGNGSNSLGAALLTAANSVIGRSNSNRQSSASNASTTGNPESSTVLMKPSASSSFRRRSRTTSLLFAMAFSNAILWLPFVVISTIIQLASREFTTRHHLTLRQLDDASKLISMLSICVNPFLYGYLNTNFNREFKSILIKYCWCCCCPNDWFRTILSARSSTNSSTMAAANRTTDGRSNYHQHKQSGSRRLPMMKTPFEVEESNSASAFADHSINPPSRILDAVENSKPLLTKDESGGVIL